MKILHLIDHMGLGGAQNIVLDLVESRDPEKIDTAVWSLSDRSSLIALERLASAGVSFRNLSLSKLNPRSPLRLRSLLGREQPDVLHTHLQFSNTFGIAAAVSLGKNRPILVSHIHNDPFQHYTRWQRSASKILASQVEAQVALTPSIRDTTDRAFRYRAPRIEVISPGINLGIFDTSRANLAQVEYFRREATRVIGTVGRLAEQKAIHILLEATPQLLKDEPSTRILIVGEGPLRQTLESQAKHLNITDSVTFAGYQSDMVSVYKAMDVFVLPSRHEGFGLVSIEAMSMGVPVVATKVVGTVDVIQDGTTGLLIPFGDPIALTSAVSRLFSEPGLQRNLCENAIRYVQEFHSRELMTAKMESLYFELAQRSRMNTPVRNG
jgi:glycosyltransferase involved in cell wall biosynthesis